MWRLFLLPFRQHKIIFPTPASLFDEIEISITFAQQNKIFVLCVVSSLAFFLFNLKTWKCAKYFGRTLTNRLGYFFLVLHFTFICCWNLFPFFKFYFSRSRVPLIYFPFSCSHGGVILRVLHKQNEGKEEKRKKILEKNRLLLAFVVYWASSFISRKLSSPFSNLNKISLK